MDQSGSSGPQGPIRTGEEGSLRASFLAYAAHEIRNPLSSALWTAELLVRMTPQDRSGARGDKLSGLCARSLGRVRILVEDLLLCERLDEGGYPNHPEPLALEEVLEAARGKLPSDAGAVAASGLAGVRVRADRPLLERALEGLLAVAAEGGPATEVVAAEGEGAVEVRVHGRPLRTLEDPRRGAPPDQSGRALTLPMVRRVARALGGALAAEEGAYRLRIPAA